MKRALRWLKRLVELVLFLIVIGTVALLVLNYTACGREQIRKYAEKQLQGAFPGGAKIGKLEGSVFDELILSDVEIDGRDQKPMVVIGTIKVTADVGALLGKTVHLDRVELDRVAVSIHPQPPAPPSPPSPPSTGGGSSWSIEMPRLELTNGTVEVSTATGMRIAIDKLDVGGSLLLPAGGAMVSRLAAHGEWEGKPMIATAIASYNAGVLNIPWASLGGLRSFLCVLDARYDDSKDLVSGVVTVKTPAATVEKWSNIKLPGDILAVANAAGSTDHNHVGIDGILGDARVLGYGDVDVKQRRLRLFASASAADLGPVTFDRVHGHGTATAALQLSETHASGSVAAVGAINDRVDSTVVALVDTDYKTAHVGAVARREQAHVSLIADLARDGTDVRLVGGWLRATATDPRVQGTATMHLAATGPLAPAPSLDVNGNLHVDRLGYAGANATSLDVDLTHYTASLSPTGPIKLTATNLTYRTAAIPKATIDATVSYTDTLAIAITSHQIDTLDGTWTGGGGTIKLGPTITVDHLHTGLTGSAITVSHASFTPATQDLTAKIGAENVAVATAIPDGHGTLDGKLDVKRTGGAWSGTAHLVAHHAWVGEEGHGADVDANVTLAGRRVTLDAKASEEHLGDATLVADIDGPRDLLDPDAWSKLPRTAVRSATIDVPRFEADDLGASGTGHGKISIDAGEIHGEIHGDGIEAGTNTVKVDATIGPGDGDEIAADAVAVVSDVVTGKALARVAVPAHFFDPVAWKALDRQALRGVVVHLDDNLDPSVFATLGLGDIPYRGKVSATINVEEGATGAAVIADLSDVTGGVIVKPVGVKVNAGIDRNGVSADADLLDGDVKLLTASLTSALTFDHLVAKQQSVVSLTGKITIPQVFAKDLVAIIGEQQITGGTVAGDIDVDGTFGTPTGHGHVEIRDVTLVPTLGGKVPPRLDRLDVTGEWGGASGHAELTATEKTGGTLHANLAGTPVHGLAGVSTEIDAKSFDIAPLAAFAPSPWSSASGTITSANINYEPAGALTGEAHVANAMIPLTAQIGTLRDTKGDFTISGDTVTATATGKLGGGTAELKGKIVLAGALPHTVDASLKLRGVSPLGKYQPTLDADLDSIKLTRDLTTGNWSGTMHAENGKAEMSLAKADELFGVGAPSDMIFVDAAQKPKDTKNIHIPPPEAPWLDVKIRIEPAEVRAYDPRAQGVVGDISGVVEGDLEFTLGDGIGLDGKIITDRGSVEIVGRRYDVDVADLSFDGTIYPKVNVKITHNFAEMGLSIEVHGELPSDFKVTPTSDTPGYSEDQLYGFVFGGEPGGDPASASQDAAKAAGSSVIGSTLLSTKAGRKLRYLTGISTIKYTPQTDTTSAVTEVGKWLDYSWLPGTAYVAFRNHIQPLPTENQNEGEMEWYLQKRVLVDGVYGDRQYDGLDLLYRLRW